MRAGWQILDFDAAVEDVSAGSAKTPQSAYKPAGEFAVVDQGKALVAGYVDDEALLCKALLPVVIFGDHTRCFKFVDFPFGIGADGVKVLKPKGSTIDEKYLFHFLRQLRLPDGGYDRHYKYLKRERIPFPPLPEQRRIAAILDQAEALRAQRRAAIAQLDSLGQAVFVEMFGDVLVNDRKWAAEKALGDVANIASGVTKGRNLNGKAAKLIPYLAVANVQDKALDLTAVKNIEATEDEIRRYRLRKDDLLLTEGGDPDKLGRGTLWNEELPEAIHQNHIFRVRLTSSEITPLFLNWLVGSQRGKRYFLKSAKQTTGIASINMTQLRGFPLLQPPIAVQEVFAHRIQSVEQLKATHRTALARLDELFASLQHRAFRGELTRVEASAVRTQPVRAVHLEGLRILESAVGLETLIFVAKRMPSHDLYKSLKAIYFADKRHLERHGRLIYGETHSALPHGPVPQAAYDATRVLNGERLICDFDDDTLRAALRREKSGNAEKLVPLRDADFTRLGSAERESLEWAIRYCADMSFEQVKAASHDTAYDRTPANAPIPMEYLVEMLPVEVRRRRWGL